VLAEVALALRRLDVMPAPHALRMPQQRLDAGVPSIE
jgi:hypothetical protein